jgi:hypothetical protein
VSQITELYGVAADAATDDWPEIVEKQHCPFLKRRCIKVRKSAPDQTIGTCSVLYGKDQPRPILICPHRFLGRSQVFADGLHLLALHEPGNDLHLLSEVFIPGGSVDYFLVSVRDHRVKDFVGIEFQTLDTTGTVWPERQRFLEARGIEVDSRDLVTSKGFGMNWKMTAKTILVQLHHKVQTFESLGKHLVLVVQDHFMDYMRGEFQFDHVQPPLIGNALHIHTYQFSLADPLAYRLTLDTRLSTDSQGIAKAIGLRADPHLTLNELLLLLETRLSDQTLFVPIGLP